MPSTRSASCTRKFQTFKNEDKFRRVGYGWCCKYYQWMKEVDSAKGRPKRLPPGLVS